MSRNIRLAIVIAMIGLGTQAMVRVDANRQVAGLSVASSLSNR